MEIAWELIKFVETSMITAVVMECAEHGTYLRFVSVAVEKKVFSLL